MKIKVDSGGGGEFLQQPEGMVQGVLCDVVDEGLKETPWGAKPKLSLRFQSSVLITKEDFEKQGIEVREDAIGQPFLYTSWYTASLNERSRLTMDLKSWGVSVPESGEFELDDLIGRNALLNVQALPPKGDRKTPFMAVQTINPLPSAMPPITVSPTYVRVADREERAVEFNYGANTNGVPAGAE